MTAALRDDGCDDRDRYAEHSLDARPDGDDSEDGHGLEDPADPPAPLRPITIRPAPVREPPFEDDLAASGVSAVRQAKLPFAEPDPIQAFTPLTPPSWGNPALPDPKAWMRRIMVGIIEVRAGHRSLNQLSAYLSPPVLRDLAAELPLVFGPPGRPCAVRSVHGCIPADGVAEVSAILQTGTRFRAVAARLEASHGRWRCVRLQIG